VGPSVLHESVSKLSLAVQLKPDFGAAQLGVVSVFAATGSRRFQARGNPSGYFVFNELPSGNYVVQVRPQLFLDEDRPVTLPLVDPQGPVLKVQLKPKWFFPFVEGATLIRGSVRGPEGPVPGAVVKLRGSTLESRTGEDGRFVLCFPPAKEETLSTAGFMKAADGTTGFQLQVTHPGFHARSFSIKDIREGSVTTIRKAIELVHA
jgi:hypothetical protein